MDDERDDQFFKQLKPTRSEVFWTAQRTRILSKIEAPAKRGAALRWATPAFAAALAAVLIIERGHKRAEASAPPPQQWAMLESLDLLENWDDIQRVDLKDAK